MKAESNVNTDELHRPCYIPDILANALNQTPERPFLQLAGGPMLTVGQVRDATSQFVQALQSVGVGPGTRVATLSSNRPEVMHVAHSIQLLAAIARTSATVTRPSRSRQGSVRPGNAGAPGAGGGVAGVGASGDGWPWPVASRSARWWPWCRGWASSTIHGAIW